MPDIQWSYDARRRLLRLLYLGTLDIGLFKEASAIRDGIDVPPGRALVLIDGRDADLSELTSEDFLEMERLRAEVGLVNDRTAALVGRESDLGIAKLWALYRNRAQADTTAISTSVREALEWLFDEA